MSYTPQPPPPTSNSWAQDDNSIVPDNTATGLLDLGGAQRSYQVGGTKQTLNGEQIDWLLKRLSTDDQQEIGTILRECTWQMTTTRGLPFAALVTGFRAANRQHVAPGAIPQTEYQPNDPLQAPSRPRPSGIFYDDQPPPMSGTPVGSSYGDNGSGFSKS
uniref:Replication protein n=1 Tax=Panagrellus redivivus TaxID=6233 RepID=A0A7E4VAV5_PANRE